MRGNQLLGIVIGMSAFLAGCDGLPPRAPGVAAGEGIVETAEQAVEGVVGSIVGEGEASGGAAGSTGETDAGDAPAVIYYDLTAFDWYRRGEPIILEGRQYVPGQVQPTGERRFRHEGSYDGVDYYIQNPTQGSEAAPNDTIYVPVYQGYWLPFAPEEAQRSAPVE